MPSQNILAFLNDLAINNNRDWFTANKGRFDLAKKEFDIFTDILISKISSFDPSIGALMAKDSVFRIYRDARFSKDKTPYKLHFGTHIARGGRKSIFSGYYLQVQPGNKSFMGGGIYRPETANLKAVRTHVYENIEEFEEIINETERQNVFGSIEGDKLKTAPKGFPKDFGAIDLLKFKDYTLMCSLTDDELLSADFLETLAYRFMLLKPFGDFLNHAIEHP